MTDKFAHEVFFLSINGISYNAFPPEVKQWLVENIGLPHHTWTNEYGGIGYIKFKFLREEDATLFALRWS